MPRPALSLKARALAMLARREHSRAELRRKLLPHARAAALAAAQAAVAPASASALDRASPALAAEADVDADAGTDTEFDSDNDSPFSRGRRSRRPARMHRSPGPAPARPGVFSSEGAATAPVVSAEDTAAAWAEAEEAVEALLEWLQAQRYLSEERFVESRVHARAARFGNLRIRQELAQHGVALDEDAAQRLRDSELERCREVWARKFGGAPPTDAAQRARQMRFLAGRGFGADVIRRVLQSADD